MLQETHFVLILKKRRVERSVEEGNFLGFKTSESGNLKTNVKGSFGVQSDWPQLCHLVNKVGVILQWEKQEKMISLKLEMLR